MRKVNVSLHLPWLMGRNPVKHTPRRDPDLAFCWEKQQSDQMNRRKTVISKAYDFFIH